MQREDGDRPSPLEVNYHGKGIIEAYVTVVLACWQL
jgi:hypothetical protein